MHIKKVRQLDFCFLVVIISFAFDFGNIKYALAWAFSAFCLLLAKKNNVKRIKHIGKEYLFITIGFLVLFVITLFFQLKNGFNSYAINEAVYDFTPLLFAFSYTQVSKKDNIEDVMNYSFAIFIIAFLKTFITQLTIENIMSLSFTDSYSPFESELAFIFLVFECYFLFKSKKKFALISLILCVLSFKRICMLFAILFFIFSGWLTKDKKVDKKVVITATVFFVLLPVVTCFMLNDSFESWFYSQFGISLHEATLSRSSRIEMVMNSGQIKYGLGSVTTYMTKALNDMHGSNYLNRSLHNDLVQIYLECGIVGSSILTYVYMKATSFNRTTFILMCYIFVECYFNHLFGAGTAQIWILIYLLFAFIDMTTNKINEIELDRRAV